PGPGHKNAPKTKKEKGLKSMLKNFRTYHLAIDLYRSCQVVKPNGPGADQFERALLSIPLNLAEGSAKPTVKDRKKFYFIALGSLREVQAMLHLFGTPELVTQADILAAHIYRLGHG
ncbi:MAG: four helix bundle protein, partial [Bacteriovoracia bacterium]